MVLRGRSLLLICLAFRCNEMISCDEENITSSDDPCASLRMVSRAEWGARDPVQVNSLPLPVERAFIHHTAWSQCLDFESCCAEMRKVQNFHMDQRGWWDIGYSFLIGGDGRVYEGRGWDAEGAHTRGFNSISLAVSLMGDYRQESPSQLMLDTTQNWIRCGKLLGKMSEDVRISGHRDGRCTDCPGDALYQIIEQWPGFEKGPLPGYNCDPLPPVINPS